MFVSYIIKIVITLNKGIDGSFVSKIICDLYCLSSYTVLAVFELLCERYSQFFLGNRMETLVFFLVTETFHPLPSCFWP